MNAEQCRMARAGLGLGVRELASLADVAPGTIARLEKGEGLYPRTVETVKAALERRGVVFIGNREESFGVLINRKFTNDDR